MPWKGWKHSESGGNNAPGRNTPNAEAPTRHSEHVPRSLHPEDYSVSRLSESTTDLPLAGDSQAAAQTHAGDNPNETGRNSDHTSNQQTARRKRFSMMRFRHASDPQLSASFNQSKPPPVPAVPPPPTIITTAPTLTNLDPPTKRKNPFKISPKKSILSHGRANTREHTPSNTSPSHTPSASIKSATAPQTMRASHISFEEPGRLSTTSLRSAGPRGSGDTSNQSGPVSGARLSESSRSDASSGENPLYRVGSRNGNSSSHSFFRIPRLRKNHSPLFPLPPELHPSGSSSAHVSPVDKPSYPGSGKQALSNDPSREQLSPFHSPSQSSVGQMTPATTSTTQGLFRKDSVTSAHSARSSLSLTARTGRRGRSSTMGSLADIQDDPHQSSPDLVPSSRTSTTTTARKSFSDLFGFTHRMRQDSEPPVPGNGSSIFGAPITPASITSKPNSLSIARELASFPAREEGDTPATYLSQLENTVRRGAIATILSQSAEEFYAISLRRYMRTFAFFGDPIDMAIRKLLMEAELPKETQQIDRVIQGFADRYHECNPGIFSSPDQAYFIAFSLLILHTDVYNRNNKRKMQKQDYVRNTRGEGVDNEILECLYENICYTPFIHVEDELNFSKQLHAPKPRRPLFRVPSTDHLPRVAKEPVDPYTLILDGKLNSLRPNLKDVMDTEDVYSLGELANSPDMNALHTMFYKSCILQIVSARSRPDAFLTQSSIANPAEAQPGLVDIRVAKVGLLWRKEPQRKKTRSPWQEWGAILTGSQLYLFRDIQWVKSLISQCDKNQKNGRRHGVTFKPPLTDFKPDAVMSTDEAVALLDSSYKKHKHAFLFVRHGGLEEVFLANSETEMHDWMTTLNYTSAFRTTGVRMRGMIGANYEGRRTTRADSVTSETSIPPDSAALAASGSRRLDPVLVEEVSAARRELMSRRIEEADEKVKSSQKELDDFLRNIRHLQILTPIHHRARDQVILAAGRMSARVKWARLDMWRTKCYRQVLSLDLANEERLMSSSSNKLRPTISTTRANEHDQANSSAAAIPASPMSEYSFHTAPRPATPVSIGQASSVDQAIYQTPPRPERGGVRNSLSPSEHSTPARKSSIAGSKPESTLQSPNRPTVGSLTREASVTSSQGRVLDSSSGFLSSNHSTPTPSFIEAAEDHFNRETGVLEEEYSSQAYDSVEPVTGAEKDKMQDAPAEAGSSERRSKVRRSFHRSLREGPHHHRSKKGKDQAGADDGSSKTGNEGLARAKGSFTVHGKKASVITFGSEWQNISPEQRLKLRKSVQTEDSRVSDMLGPDDGTESLLSAASGTGKRTHSLRSTSTTTAMSQRRFSTPAVGMESGNGDQPTNNIVELVVEEGPETTDIAPTQLSTTTTSTQQTLKPDEILEEETESITNENDRSPTRQDETSVDEKSTTSLAHTMSRENLNRASPEQAVSA
ncbi:hypothetical protein AJ80_06456 [Polytolypa hystricis UAMH7299]|uniref:SEC7 domain-containing protein n=1 Tax=Polytolypa hystricis (strain UAMH7299) TaxID=1447883 RepID=A0A2B7XMT0_POLH7|nr:hypothetical protein AJ80_06456 [Polytolypa hystricis UAMH7299]